MFRKKISQLLKYTSDAKFRGYYNKGYYNNSSNNLDKYKSLDTYLNLYTNCKEKEKLLTNTEICFSPAIKFGSTLEEVKKDNPLEHTISENTKDCTILFYKITEGRYKFRLELHFFKNKLVFFKYILRSSGGKKMILNLFAKKYLKSEEHGVPDFSKITLTDSSRNHIEIDNSVFLAVNYFTFKYGFFDYLKNLNNNYQLQQVKGRDLEESLLLKRL